MDVVQLGLAPQARMHRVGIWIFGADEVISMHIPDHSLRGLDDSGGVGCNQTALGTFPVGGIEIVELGSGDRKSVVRWIFR